MFQFKYKPVILTSALLMLVLSPPQANAEDFDLPPEPGQSETSANQSSDLPTESDVPVSTEANTAVEETKPGVSDVLEKEATKKVVDGPLKEQRQALYDQIQAAEDSGIGIKNYMMAFNYIEEMAARGESEEAIKKRMLPLVSALAGQLKTKQYLKNRPKTTQANSGMPDPNSLLAPNQDIPSQLRKFGGLGGANTDDLIKKIVSDERLKGNIPQGLDKNNLKDKLKDPRVQELIKKYKDKF